MRIIIIKVFIWHPVNNDCSQVLYIHAVITYYNIINYNKINILIILKCIKNDINYIKNKNMLVKKTAEVPSLPLLVMVWCEIVK